MTETKKARLEEPLIGTHNGTFHADEALAISLLRSLERYKFSRLVRTRDPARLAECDIVVDVGGEYDPSRHRYDHHQRGFEETYSKDHSTKLSSAGLIYKHFGAEIVSNYLSLPLEDPRISILVPKLYNVFVEAIDGIDNGITQYEAVDGSGQSTKLTVRPKYHSGTSLSDRIGQLNPAWNEPNNPDILDTQFEKASGLAGSEFFSRLNYYFKSWLPGREIVVQALSNRFKNEAQDPQGRILIFQSFCPWKDHLHSLEKDLEIDPSSTLPLFVLYPDESQKWRIQAIPKIPGGFESRLPLPESWRGLRDNELSELITLPDSIFVHASGFIGGHSTFAGVLEMAKRALVTKKAAVPDKSSLNF